MTRVRQLGLFCALSLIGTAPAFALEMDYVTYNGFSQVVTAFRYTALFFSNDDYGGLVFIAAVVGFVAAAVLASANGYRDQGTFKNWLLTFGIGIGLYASFITPKGTIHVYDRTLNAYQPVAGVPDGIIILAGLTNLFEQVAVEIANASSPVPYENTAGGIVFQLVRNTYSSSQPIEDEYLWQNIKNYYLECGSMAAALPGTGFNLNAINRTSTDLLATFGNATSDAIEFPYRSEADPVGTLTTCTDGFTNLQAELTDPATYTSLVASLCGSVGFDTTNTAQAVQCNTILDEIIPTVFNQTGDRLTYLRSAALALAMQDAAADQNPERSIAQEANRSFTTQSLGLLGFAQEYGQSVRAGFLAATMGTLPLTMLFLVTPLRWRALSLSVGFFVFVAVWGIIDIGLQVMIEGVATDAFEEVRRNNLAFNAFMLTPPAAVKALSVFGASRLISISLASIAVVAVFRLSGASFAQLTGNFARQGEQIGSEAAETRLNPARLAEQSEGRAQAAGSLTALGATGSGGFAGITQQATGRWLQNLSHHRAFAAAGNSEGVDTADLYRFAGAAGGGDEAGRIGGLARQTGYGEAELATGALDTAATGAERGFFDASTYEDSAAQLAAHAGIDNSTAKELIEGYGATQAAGRLAGTGGDLGRVFGTSAQEEAQRIGSAEGLRAAADRAGMTPEQIAKAGGFLEGTYGAGSTDFVKSGTGGDFDNLQLGGELRHVRAGGEAAGVGEAARYTDKSEQELSGQAAALDASGRLIANERLANFAGAIGVNTSDFLNASGANFDLAVNERTMKALSPYLTPEQTEVARPGGSISGSFDPLTFEIGRLDVRSGNSGVQDDSVHVSDGFRFDARQGAEGGQTLFRYADLSGSGNLQGAALLSEGFANAKAEGSVQSYGDTLAQQTSSYLSNISGKEISFLSSDSTTGLVEGYAAVNAGGGFKLFGTGGVWEAGAKTSLSAADLDSSQLVNSYNFWNDQARDLYDRTLGTEKFDSDHVDRANAFLNGINQLRSEAVDIKKWVEAQGHEDDQKDSGESAVTESEFGSRYGPTYSEWPTGFRRH